MSDLLVEVPRSLPVYSLSKSSIETYLACPLKFKRKYIDGERERSNPNLVLGSACGDSITSALQVKVDTQVTLETENVLDLYAGFMGLKIEEDVDWKDVKPGELKDQGAKLVRLYWDKVGRTLDPIAVERKFTVTLGDADWDVNGYFDVEEAHRVIDLKASKDVSQADADRDPQPTMYLWARHHEGSPADDFQFHNLKTTVMPRLQVVTTTRTVVQLDEWSRRIVGIAREIAWRAEYDQWQGAAPKSWWCQEKFCGFWQDCPYGGRR